MRARVCVQMCARAYVQNDICVGVRACVRGSRWSLKSVCLVAGKGQKRPMQEQNRPLKVCAW
jgi:hypothetical protein